MLVHLCRMHVSNQAHQVERNIKMAHSISTECIQCGACEAECPNSAIAEEDGGFVVDSAKCEDCGDCVDVCPTNAIAQR